jgi:hypothetical protein
MLAIGYDLRPAVLLTISDPTGRFPTLAVCWHALGPVSDAYPARGRRHEGGCPQPMGDLLYAPTDQGPCGALGCPQPLSRSAAGFRRGEAVYDAAQLVGRLPDVLDQVPPRRSGAFC